MPAPSVAARLISEALEGAVAQCVTAVTLDCYNGVTAVPPAGTPILTRHARSNWIPSVGVAVATVAGSPESINTGRAAAGIAQVRAYQLDQGNTYITNSVPYIARLNDGYSRQTPAGFVDRAVADAVRVQVRLAP